MRYFIPQTPMHILLFFILITANQLFAKEVEGKSFASFYHTKNGEMIMNPETFTEGITKQLTEEHRFIMSCMIGSYDYLLEVGCGPSERAKDVVRIGKSFLGIDINPKFVDIANKTFLEQKLSQAQAEVFSALRLNKSNYMLPLDKKALIYFPFNLMGNLDDFHLVLGNMIEIGQDFCFSTYKMNEPARVARLGYYSNCGCQNIRFSGTPIGNLFDSQDGLHSAAFKIGYIVDLINDLLASKEKQANISIIDLANIAYMIYVHDIRNL